jgi:GT2 family glycosyltransferase
MADEASESARVTGVRLSVIVCTRNRADSLLRCLAAFEGLTFEPTAWELVVVNNGSTDDTDDVVRQFAARVPFRVTLAHEPVPGLSGARNRGVSCAAAPLLLFTDDDCYVDPDWLTHFETAYAADPTCGFIGGRILLHDPTDAPVTIKPDDDPEEIPAYSCIVPGLLHGANLSARREAFAAIDGFDRQLGPGTPFCADDIDFIGRLSAAGWRGRYLPDATVSHHHGRKPGPDVDRLELTYAKGRGAYFTKGCLHPRVRRKFLRGWYWHLRRLATSGNTGTILRELAAGAEYLWYRVTMGQVSMLAPTSER